MKAKVQSSDNPMFRYLEKYVGTYRVLAEYDWGTNQFPTESTFDDLYIPCFKGVIKHTYKPEILYWYTDKLGQGRNILREIEGKDESLIVGFEETDSEVLIYFKAEDIAKFAKFVKPKTNGASINPFSTRNLPKNKVKYTIPEKDLEAYNNLLTNIDSKNKMATIKKLQKDFDDVIQKKKGKKFDLKEDKDNSGLTPKEYIHANGYWNDYLKFIKEVLNG